jgi:hypothetical protein
MTIRSSVLLRITTLLLVLFAGPVLAFMAVSSFRRGNWFAATVIAVLAGLAVAAVVRSWPQTTLTVDNETITVKRAGRTTKVPRRTVRALVQPNLEAAPLEFVDERGQTLIKIVDPFHQEDLEKVADYMGLEIL